MSVVCAKVYPNKIVMCADSIVTNGWSKDTKGDFTKLKKENGIVVGSAGTAQEASLFWHYITTHNPADATEKAVLDHVIEFTKWRKDYDGEAKIENSYLLAYKNKLFNIQGLLVYEVKDFAAIGCGEDYALAALHLGHDEHEAVKVACALSCFVAEPVVTEILEW